MPILTSEEYKKLRVARETVAKVRKRETVIVTPEIAEAWLTRNTRNRKMKERHVTLLARDMRAGEWRLLDDPIRFDTAGNLIDGQHRLKAIVVSKSAQPMVVVYGYDESDQDYIDAGKPRTAGDILSVAGLHNATVAAATLRILLLEARSGTAFAGLRATRAELVDAAKAHPALNRYVMASGSLPRGISLPPVSYINYIACNYLGLREAAGQMITVLRTGVPSYEGCLMHLYREKVFSGFLHASSPGLGTRDRRAANLFTLSRAFQALARGRKLDRLPLIFQREPFLTRSGEVFDASTLLTSSAYSAIDVEDAE